LPPLFRPQVEDVVQVDIRQQGAVITSPTILQNSPLIFR
jgi:hypothetical protein